MIVWMNFLKRNNLIYFFLSSVIMGFLFYGVNEEIIMIFIFPETHKPEALKNCFIKLVAYFSGNTNGTCHFRTTHQN